MLRKQRGLTLVEVLVSLGILASITTGIVALTNQQTEDTKASVTALHLKTVGDAANEYIKDNYASVTAVATATNPALIRVSDLISGGYLSAGFNLSNARSQNTCVLVLEPTANNLTGMVVTEGGDTIDDLTLGQVAATVGAAGGGIYSTATTTFRGAMGGWSVGFGSFANPNHLNQKCDGTAGAITLAAGHPVMALWFADGSSVSATLYRDPVPGNPTLNTMNTPILMGAGTVQTAANACTTKGALARDNDGKVLTCVDNAGTLEWTAPGGGSAYWGDPQSVGTNTPTQAQLDTTLGVCSNTAPPKGRTHMVSGASGQPRPYICDGTDWQPVGIDLNGNLTVPGLLKANMLQPTYTATENTSDANCVVADNTTWGRTAKDVNGLLLSCQSGSWKKASGSASMTGFKITDGASCWTCTSYSGGGICKYGWVASGTTYFVNSCSYGGATRFCAAGTVIQLNEICGYG